MTKQDILKLKTSREIGRTAFIYPKLWDDEVNEYWVKVTRKENLEKYGSEEFLWTPTDFNGDAKLQDFDRK